MALWSLSCPALHCIEVAFIQILRLSPNSHTGIVHSVAKLDSLYNVIFRRSTTLSVSAAKCPSKLVQSVFLHSTSWCYSFIGYNTMCGSRHLKQCDPQYRISAMVIRSFRLYPQCDRDEEYIIRTIACNRDFSCVLMFKLLYCIYFWCVLCIIIIISYS